MIFHSKKLIIDVSHEFLFKLFTQNQELRLNVAAENV